MLTSGRLQGRKFWGGTMRYKGETPESPAAGKIVSYNGVSSYKFRDGKISETRNVQHFGSILSQIRD